VHSLRVAHGRGTAVAFLFRETPTGAHEVTLTEDVVNLVIARAATDPAFRARLLAEPHRALNDVFGVRIPEKVHIRFIERDAGVDALFVLPDCRVPYPENGEKIS
jgi:hypothetical protein